MAEPDPIPSITLEAAIWRREGMFVPAIACKLKSGDEYWYNAIKMPLTPLKLAIKAAQTAQLDLMKAAAEFEPPRTELDAYLYVFKMGYRAGMGVLLSE